MEIRIKSHRAPLTSGPSWVVELEGSPEEVAAVEEPVIHIIGALTVSGQRNELKIGDNDTS
jgi:hypothetical protein